MKTTRRQFGGFAASSIALYGTKGVGTFLQHDAVSPVSLQPLAAQARRVADALEAVGAPLSVDDLHTLQIAAAAPSEADGVSRIASVLNKRVLMEVRINPEARLSVARGSAPAALVQSGWSTFLLRVVNEAAATSPLVIRSPQGGSTGRRSSLAIEGVHDFSNGAVDAAESRARWIALNNYDLPPMTPSLGGLPLEYRVLQIYSRDAGLREASLIADAGFGEQDLGFRSTLPILFRCAPAADVRFRILDEHGNPVMASLLIRDAQQRVYPAQGKRELPDLAFEPQVYRADGETVPLAPGEYSVEFGRGPEYLRNRLTLHVNGSVNEALVQLQRWIDPSSFGYYSGDTHIHAAGCSHYESPSEGVTPEVMQRQVAGEALDVGSVLNWGPGFEYQRQFFSGHAAALREHEKALVRYDVEVSGFPSSHCGHLVLLQLQSDRYPGASSVESWPSWNLPILRWAKSQGAVTGYAHVGHGLVTDTTALPNYVMPPFNSSGANEFLVDITHPGVVDFLSGCDLWPFAELNVWYHTLNCGFRTAFAGETDFPCITDECVGGGRSYARLQDGAPAGDTGYRAWLAALIAGDSYFGDGRSHIFHLEVSATDSTVRGDGVERTIMLPHSQTVTIKAEVCARLEAEPGERLKAIAKSSPYTQPYWHVERARIEGKRQVAVELVVNGQAVARMPLEADGTVRTVQFTHQVERSSWVVLRIYPSSHTNPVWISVEHTPLRASRKSAVWCRQAVDACWQQKRLRIRPEELEAAATAYDHARQTYDGIVRESYHDGPADSDGLRIPSVFPVT